MSNARDNRRKIKVLQENNSANQSRLVGNNGFVRINQSKENVSVSGKPDRRDPTKCESKSTCDLPRARGLGVQLVTSAIITPVVNSSDDALVASDSPSVDEVIRWMTTAESPEGYWKLVAEERRIALADTLTENKEVSEQLEIAEKTIEMLKAERQLLKDAIAEGRTLAKLLQELVEDNEKEEQ